ncbi:MAG TPA: hemolysin family protein [Dissulfurispiraceae bacterium]|nr:hemolysin family protein [Dissulfurispiraceae bacterium]
MMLDIFVIFMCIAVTAFFAAAEIAVVTARRSKVKQMIDSGSGNATLLQKLKGEPDRFLATVQVGVTLAGALASALGGVAAIGYIKPIIATVPIPFIATYSESIAIGMVVLTITYVTLVFGELIPKSIALSNPEGIGLFAAPIIERISHILTLLVRILTASTNFILKPFGRKAFTERGYISEEEIKLLLEEGGEQGIFEDQEKELIHSVFEFTDTSVREVMIPATQMVTISIAMTFDDVRKIISEEKFSRYPVIGRDINDIRGVLYAKDFHTILCATGAVDIRRIIKPPIFVPEAMKISNLLRDMQKRRVHMAIVIDEYGAVSGLVSLEDLLEEIVGEIRDEYDTESPVIQLPDGAKIIDASLSISDLADNYGIVLEQSPDYETLGGFILAKLQRIPKTGDEIELDAMKLRIVEMVGQRIAKVRLELIERELLEE